MTSYEAIAPILEDVRLSLDEAKKADVGDQRDRRGGTYVKVSDSGPRWKRWKKVKAKIKASVRKGEVAGKGAHKKRSKVAASVAALDAFVRSGKLQKGLSVSGHLKVAKEVLGQHEKRFDRAMDRMTGLASLGTRPEWTKGEGPGGIELRTATVDGEKISVGGRVKTLFSAVGKLTRKPDNYSMKIAGACLFLIMFLTVTHVGPLDKLEMTRADYAFVVFHENPLYCRPCHHI